MTTHNTRDSKQDEQHDRIWVSRRAFVHACVPTHCKESEGDWFVREVRASVAAVPPATPSDAAMDAQQLVNQWQAAWISTQDISRDSEADLVRRVEAAIITRHLGGASDKENPVSTVTFGDSKNIANPDVSCPRCGGTKPTCCSCPEPKQFSLPEFAREFTQAAINAHVGFKHETRWHDCNYASCAKWREMIDMLNAAAATTSPETPVGVYASVIEFCIRRADEYNAADKESDNGDKFLATKAIAYREMANTLSRGELPLTRCGECDQVIAGTRYCFNCIQVLKEKVFVSSLPADDLCAIAGHHVCGPMDRERAEAVKNAMSAVVATTDNEGEEQ